MTYTVFTREKRGGRIRKVESGLSIERARALCSQHNGLGDCTAHKAPGRECDCPWWEFENDGDFKARRKVR